MWWFTETTRPPTYEPVLFYPGRRGRITIGHLGSDGWYDNDNEDNGVAEPTHWMPLPDPPK